MRIDKGLNLDVLYGRAMVITDQAEADMYLDTLITYRMENTECASREEAEQIERSNLGYWAGYYSNETRARVERLFRCEHPYFGSIAKNGPPSPEQALAIGVALGERARKES